MKRDERGIISPYDMKKGSVKAGYTFMVLLMIVIVLFAIRLLRREKQSLDTMYGQAGAGQKAAG